MTLVHTPTAATPRIERFVDRVAALTPSDWGQLDAIGDRLLADDPLARLERARVTAGLMSMGYFPESAMLALVLIGGAAIEIVNLFRGRRPKRGWPPRSRSRQTTPEAVQLDRLLELILVNATPVQGARAGATASDASRPPNTIGAALVLLNAAAAIVLDSVLSPEAFARAYGPIAPVISLDSL